MDFHGRTVAESVNMLRFLLGIFFFYTELIKNKMHIGDRAMFQGGPVQNSVTMVIHE